MVVCAPVYAGRYVVLLRFKRVYEFINGIFCYITFFLMRIEVFMCIKISKIILYAFFMI
jgi:hypothetical protein